MGLVLETSDLLLRDYLPEDAQDYCALVGDALTMRYLPDLYCPQAETALRMFGDILRDAASPVRTQYFLRIEHKVTRAQVGSIGYTVTASAPQGKLAHAGYFLLPLHWDKGYATQAMRALLDYAFVSGGVLRLATGCLEENIGSMRVMQKCGMVREAEKPLHTLHEGQLKTRLEYRLLACEYAAFVRKHQNPAATDKI